MIEFFFLFFFSRNWSQRLSPHEWIFLWRWKMTQRLIKLSMGARNICLTKQLIDIFVLVWRGIGTDNLIHYVNGFFLVEPRYAYAFASTLHGVRHILWKDFMLKVWHNIMSLDVVFNIWCYHIKLLSNMTNIPNLNLAFLFVKYQPPWDLETNKKYIHHYTYGFDYNMKVKYFFALNCIVIVFKYSL